MRSDFPAGLDRSTIEYILEHDDEVLTVERIDGATALWKISVSVDGRDPVVMVLDNGVNEIYVQALLAIDHEHIADALSAVGPIAVVGVAILEDTLYMRSGFFIEHSTMHALTNSYCGLAYAYWRYQQAIEG